MKFFDRRAVEDTDPRVFIGRRIYVNRQGQEQVTESWHAECFYKGHTHCVSLNTASLSVAIHRAHQLSEKVREVGAAPVRRAIDLAELARLYLAMQTNRNRAPKTLEAYELCLACFVAWAKPRFNGPAETFTTQLFWEFHRAMVDDGYAAKTRAARLVLIKQIFKWGALEELIARNPLQREKVDEAKAAPQPCYDPAQVNAILEETINEQLARALYATLAYSGIRFGEARALRWINVVMPQDRAGHLCIAEGGSDETTKNGETRRIPMHPELRKILEALPRRGELVFYSPRSKRHPDGGRPLNQSTWLKHLKQVCARCGFENPDQYKLHTFRHAFASMCARNSVAYKYALTWLGHSSS